MRTFFTEALTNKENLEKKISVRLTVYLTNKKSQNIGTKVMCVQT